MSWCGVTDEWVEETGRGKHYCKTVYIDPCTHPHTHRTPTYKLKHLNLGADKHMWSRSHAHTHTLCLRADLIIMTPISERWWLHGGGRGRLSGCPVRWTVRALTHISSPRQFKSAQPVNQHAALTNGWCHCHPSSAELPSKPNESPKLTTPIFFCTTYQLSMWTYVAVTNSDNRTEKNLTQGRWRVEHP